MTVPAVGGLHSGAAKARSSDPALVRIDFLDGLRGVAILVVILYHYYSRFAPDPRGMYPYGDVWAGFPLFAYGYYGVHLFFAVSGFVIALTLFRCRSMFEFGVRRLARLWPTMLLCSVITFVFLRFVPDYWPQRFANFLPSLTFIEGPQFNRLLRGRDFRFIDGAYWSLFVEVRFYAISAVLYFAGRRSHYFHRMFWFSVAVFGAYYACVLTGRPRAATVIYDLAIPDYLPWFLLGTAAYCHWRRVERWPLAFTLLTVPAVVLGAIVSGQWMDLPMLAGVCILFALSFTSMGMRRALSMRWLTAIGVSSYSLYLLHQNIGVTLIAKFAAWWGITGRLSLALPVLVGALMIAVARRIHLHWETPLNRSIVRRFRRARADAGGMQAPA